MQVPNSDLDHLVLVIGGTGKTGRRIVDRLDAIGVPVRNGSRRAERPFDWRRPHTWARALEGVRAMYVAYHPDLSVPAAAGDITRLIDVARRAGVERVVLLSGRGEPGARHCERLVQESGLRWTVLRCSWFAQNFSEGFMHDMVMSGVLALPVDVIPEPFIDIDDVAEIAAQALTTDRHLNTLHELTGPRSLRFTDAVAAIAKATGKDIRFTTIPHADFLTGLALAGVPGDFVSLLDYLMSEILDGRNRDTTDGVQRALGRPATDFVDYVRKTAAAGVWNEHAASASVDAAVALMAANR